MFELIFYSLNDYILFMLMPCITSEISLILLNGILAQLCMAVMSVVYRSKNIIIIRKNFSIITLFYLANAF